MTENKSYSSYRGLDHELTKEELKLDSETVNWFSITGLQAKDASKFVSEHKCRYSENSGAIGGRFTYQFCGTSMGVIFKVICACGEEADFTDYFSW